MSEPLDLETLKASALAVLASLEQTAAVPPVAAATETAPAGEGGAATPPEPAETAPGAENTAAAGTEPPVAAPVPDVDAIRSRLEGSVIDLTAKAAVATLLPGYQGLVAAALRPSLRLAPDGRVLLGDDVLDAETVTKFIVAHGGDPLAFIPSTGVGGSGLPPVRHSSHTSPQGDWATSQKIFEEEKRGRH